jgi:hypothetical protein
VWQWCHLSSGWGLAAHLIVHISMRLVNLYDCMSQKLQQDVNFEVIEFLFFDAILLSKLTQILCPQS